MAAADLDALADMLTNRVRKNQRRLAPWARAEAVTCYRVYDRDIPELPITVDRYEGHLVINDYRRRWADRPEDPAGEAAWLDRLAAAAAVATGTRAEDIHVKRRERMTNRRETGKQYGKVGEAGAWLEVGEAGLRFWVNLSDYLDTGLFLDHRRTRAMVASEAAGRRVLNLFCYTAAFTVHAAAAGARASVSVDLSNTYLDWAAGNLELNGLDPVDHRLVAADVRTWLDDAARRGERFDVAVVDPPTFSNSKRMDGTFDVQRDHGELLRAVRRLMEPGGRVWFSTNHQRFKLDDGDLGDLAVEDVTEATIPPDFRDRKVHRCWVLTCPPSPKR